MAHTLYENFILENKMTDLVNTKINVNALYTVDNSLALEAGLKKVINKYTYTGGVEQLAKGAKNTDGVKGSASYISKEYVVERYQQTYEYNDQDVMKDPYLIDVLSTGAAQVMANHIRTQYFGALSNCTNIIKDVSVFNYDAVVDALAQIGQEVESDLFIVMGLSGRNLIRKDPDFKASKQGEILYTGQFGTIAGIPCVFSQLAADEVFITAKDQVKFFVKKEGSVEQDRDIETKDNTVVYERYGLMALVDETKTIKMILSI